MRLILGDCLEVMKTLPDKSVHCCVTSPPYYGLRDYGTARWEGGNPDCDHRQGRNGSGRADGIVDDRGQRNRDGVGAMGGDCRKCGAKWADLQLGLEKTPEEYVAKMVEVFREVRRVLRDDGTLWLNLGSSYAGSGKGGNPEGSPWSGYMGGKDREAAAMTTSVLRDRQPTLPRLDVLACGNDGKGLQDSQVAGRACPGSYDESQAESPIHPHRNARTDQSVSLSEPQILKKGHDNGNQDCVPTFPGALPPDVRASTTRASYRRDRAACVPATKALVSPKVSCSSSGDEPPFLDNSCLNYTTFSQYVKPKDLIPIPWMVAMALQKDGWYLRQDIIWHKPNPMPESVTDRCTKSHEYIFLLAKSQKYYYDAEAIKEPIKDSSAARLIQENQKGSDRVPGKTNGPMKAVLFGGTNRCPDTRLQSGKEWNPKMAGGGSSYKNGHSGYFKKDGTPLTGIMANKKSVWTITTKPFREAHFATFPPDLIEPMIKAGCPIGGIVLDPFSGAGTTGLVAVNLGRDFIGVELNPIYIAIAERRIKDAQAQMTLPLSIP